MRADARQALGDVAPPFLHDLAPAQQRRADISGESPPGGMAFSGTAVRTGTPAMIASAKFVAQAPAGRLLLGEFVDHEEIDVKLDRARRDNCGIGKPISIELAGNGAAAEWLTARNLAPRRNVAREHGFHAVCALEVSLDDAADAHSLPREILGEVGEQRIRRLVRAYRGLPRRAWDRSRRGWRSWA